MNNYVIKLLTPEALLEKVQQTLTKAAMASATATPATAAAAPAAPAERRITGSVDRSSGDIACAGDLSIEGNVLDGREISAGGTIHVQGAVQAATVLAGRDLRVDGGISGRNKARCRAGGALTARYIASATIDAAGAVTVLAEILNSDVNSGGNITVEKGAIIGGRVRATGSITCARLGASGRTQTIVEAGVDAALGQALHAAVGEIKIGRGRAAKIRDVVTPLLKNQKRLTAQQKEKATELLFEADEIDRSAAALVANLVARSQAFATHAKPLVRVSEAIVAGVILRLGDCETTIENTLKGPTTAELYGTGNNRHIRVTNAAGASLALPTHQMPCALTRFRKEAGCE